MALEDPESREQGDESERQLIRDIAGGSADALARLYDRHAAMVYGLAYRILQTTEDAEVLVEEVLAQVWQDAPRFQRRRASVVGWLITSTRARAIARLRSRRAAHDDDVPSTSVPTSSHELVELAYFDGLTLAELAERTGAPLGSIKTRLRTAMFALRGATSS